MIVCIHMFVLTVPCVMLPLFVNRSAACIGDNTVSLTVERLYDIGLVTYKGAPKMEVG